MPDTRPVDLRKYIPQNGATLAIRYFPLGG
jgi:hypothetical protein